MGGGRGGAGRGGPPGGMPGGRREAPPINTVDLILSRGTELALTPAQVTALTAVKAQQDSALRVVRLRLDSLLPREPRPEGAADGAPDDVPPPPEADALDDFPPGGPGDGRRRPDRAAFERVLADRKGALERGRKAAFAVLDKSQRKRAEQLEKARRTELEEERGAGAPFGGRGGWGGRPGGGAGMPGGGPGNGPGSMPEGAAG